MASLTLTIVGVGLNQNAVDASGPRADMVYVVENQPVGTVLAVIKGWGAGEILADVQFTAQTPDLLNGVAGDDSGRYGIMQAASAGPGYAVGDWIVYIKTAKDFDFENPFGDDFDVFQKIDFQVTAKPGKTLKNQYDDPVFIFPLADVNEAPTNLDFTPQTALQAGQGANLDVLTVSGGLNTFDGGYDPDTQTDAWDDNEYVFQGATSEDATYSYFGEFKIEKSTGKITTASTLTGGTKTLNVTVRDKADPNNTKLQYTESVDVTVAAGNTAPHSVRVNGGSTVSVAEGASVVVGTLSATDADGHAITDYNFSNGTKTSSNFTIVNNNGTWELRATNLDFEAATKTFNLDVRATDNQGAVGTANTITVNVTDVNEAPHTVRLNNATSVNLAENESGPTVLGTLSATDPEGNPLTYTFSNNSTTSPDGKFEIFNNGSTWGIRLAAGQSLDFETAQSHTLNVVAKDASASSVVTPITVNVTNVNEAPSAVAASPSINTPENAAPGMIVVASLSATDPDAGDTVSYVFAGTDSTTSPDGKFEIFNNSGTWAIRLAAGQSLDFETAQSHTFLVQAKDNNGATGPTNQRTVNVTNVDEAPAAVRVNTFTTVNTAENSTLVGNLSATDPEGNPITDYNFSNGTKLSDDGMFVITGNSASGFQIQLAQGKSLNHEGTTSYQFAVKAADSGNPAGGSANTITVNVTNVNEAPSDITFTGSPNIQANVTGAGVQVVDANAVDQDTPASGFANNKFKFGNNSLTDGKFIIDADTGVITTNAAIPAGDAGQKTLQVVAYDASNPALSTTKDYTFTIAAAPNTAPANVKVNNATTVNMVENATVVGVLSATDAEGDAITDYTFSNGLKTSSDNKFEIVNNGGTWQVQVAAGQSVNYEAATTHSFDVRATDSKGLTGAATPVTVNVTDVNEGPTAVTFTGQSNIQANVTGAGVQVVDANAVDPDGAGSGFTNNKFRFGNNSQTDGKFIIDADTGVITTTGAITAVDVEQKTLTVVTYDPNNPAFTASSNYTFTIAPAGSTAPTDVLVNGATTVNVAENATLVGTLSATDANGDAITNYTFLDGTNTSPDGMFKIINNGGTWQVQLAAGKSLDFESATKTYSFSVKATDSTGLTSAATPITVNITDVNEAPSNVTFKNQQFIQAGVTGAGVQVVDADAIDPDGPANSLNKFKFSNDTQQDGKFIIDADTGQITTNDVITAADAGPKDLTVVTYDPGNPALTATNTHTVNIALPNGFTEPTISIVAQDTAKLEGPSGTTAFTFTLSRSSNVGLSTVKMLLVGTGADPVASSDIDSITVDGAITNFVEFAHNETTKTVTVLVKGDSLDENDEAFSIVLYSPQNASISKTDGIASAVIRDDDNAPTDIGLKGSNATELAATGSVVGTLSATDPDSGSAFTYALLDSAGGRFRIVGTQLLVDNGFLLDFEQAASHRIKVQVNDGSGHTFVKDLTVSVTDWATEVTAGSLVDDVFKGGAGIDNLAGNAGNDKLYGDDGNDILSGGVGNDYIWGGAGKDTLTGNTGKDFFVFDSFNAKTNKKTNVDAIKDFKVKDDTIYLDNAVFKALGKAGTEIKPAKMKKDAFWIGSKAHDKNDRIIYDNKKGVLYYDADGTGAKAAVQIATISKKLLMTEKDFFII